MCHVHACLLWTCVHSQLKPKNRCYGNKMQASPQLQSLKVISFQTHSGIRVYRTKCNHICSPHPVLPPNHLFIWASRVVLVVKNPPANAGNARDSGSIPGSGRSPGRGNGNPLQYSCLENSMGRGVWRARVHGVTKSGTRPRD